MYDLYVPIVPETDIKVPFEQAQEWVIEACTPLGKEYTDVLQKAFSERWIDIYENRGKRSGAYSSGCFDSFPYLLLNYNGTLDDVFTLAHELGHSMHSWLANENQSHRYASYPIFIAEIASTLNEALLLDYLLKTSKDSSFKAYLLNHLCDAYKGTVYRQVQFAEYEKHIHELEAKHIPLTNELLTKEYYKINQDYYGSGMNQHENIGMEWARIPHFYYNFYVYKYATSFCASQIFADRILSDASTCTPYLNLLKKGGSADPLDLIKRAGVDLTDRTVLESSFASFSKSVSALAKELKI